MLVGSWALLPGIFPITFAALRSERGISREAQNRMALRSSGTMVTRLQHHHHSRAHFHPAVEIDHILIGHSDAARGNRASDVFRLIGAVDAIQRILAAGVKV